MRKKRDPMDISVRRIREGRTRRTGGYITTDRTDFTKLICEIRAIRGVGL
jgi:hypothetical protein